MVTGLAVCSKRISYSLKSAEKHLKGIAYASVFIDGFVALATILSLLHPNYLYLKFLYISDYMVFGEVIVAALLGIFILYIRYAKRASKRLSLAYFRYRVSSQKRQTRHAEGA